MFLYFRPLALRECGLNTLIQRNKSSLFHPHSIQDNRCSNRCHLGEQKWRISWLRGCLRCPAQLQIHRRILLSSYNVQFLKSSWIPDFIKTTLVACGIMLVVVARQPRRSKFYQYYPFLHSYIYRFLYYIFDISYYSKHYLILILIFLH